MASWSSVTLQLLEGAIPDVWIPLGRLPLKKLTEIHVQRLYSSMQDRGLSARTVRYTHAVLRRALKQAIRWKYIPRNPCDDADPPKVQRIEMRPFDREQARRLLDVAQAITARTGLPTGSAPSTPSPYTSVCALVSSLP